MPRADPFTRLCQTMSRLTPGGLAADLHAHTTASDGDYTPSQLVALAKAAGLAAVAVTDHDTTAAVAEAAASARGIEVVSGVEISTSFGGRELHLLGLFVRPDDPGLIAALAPVVARRRDRFHEYIAALAERGTPLPADRVRLVEEVAVSLGRRHVAGLLVACGFAVTRNEAFGRLLRPASASVGPKVLVPIDDAIRVIHTAGGVASLAHPPADLTDDDFRTLREFELDGLEVEYPWGRASPAERLRGVARECGFVVTGGSDCHGADPPHRRVGSCGLTAEAFAAVRRACPAG